MVKEYLVTGQAYEKKDQHKQTILLHDAFVAKDEWAAEDLFNQKFKEEYSIIKIYSVIDISINT